VRRVIGVQVRGLVDSIRMGRVPARTLAIADSRALVRSMFLASAVQIDLLPYLRGGRPFSAIVDYTGCSRPDRLRAWLWIGSELGELSRRGEVFGVRGRRSRALADGDRLLSAHYRSMLEYQVGPYGSLDQLLRSDAGEGRSDLSQYADDIAQVSLAAAPFVSSFVRQAVAEVHPENVLDVGCGTGVYTRVVLDADAHAHVEGIDLAEEVIEAARRDLDGAGYGSRVDLHVGDVRRWTPGSARRFDLVMLLNNVYYFDQPRRVALYQDMGELLTERGQLLIVSMLAPGSVAAAHLHFMLTCQAAPSSLPGRAEIEGDLGTAGFRIVTNEVLVPTEPFIGLRATRC
jgi:SAM-dependent methyltransferase